MKALDALNQVIDSISAAAFKTLDNGQTAYFPHGVFGGGYILPDEAAVGRVRQSLRHMWYAMLGVCAFSGPIATGVFKFFSPGHASTVCAAFLVAIALVTYAVMARAASGFERTDAKLTVRDAYATQIKATPRWFAIFQIVFSGVMVLAGVYMIRDAASTSDLYGGIAATIIFSALLIGSSYSAWSRSH